MLRRRNVIDKAQLLHDYSEVQLLGTCEQIFNSMVKYGVFTEHQSLTMISLEYMTCENTWVAIEILRTYSKVASDDSA